MIPLDARPRLASKARLRFDKRTEQYVLLYPEKGLLLNRTGSSILLQCTGDNTVQLIIDRLGAEHDAGAPDVIGAEVLSFLGSLIDRGLVQVDL